MIPDRAFSRMQNAYCWRDRIRKRFGSIWLGGNSLLTRLRMTVATTDGTGAASGTVPGTQFNIGQMFSIGSSIYTVYQNGTMLISGTGTTATFNTANGAFSFTGAPLSTTVYWYPALPVMGLATFETPSIDADISVAFDTQFSYLYNGGWDRITSGASTWTGDNSQFFWGTTYYGIEPFDYTLYVTNFNQNEPMRYLFNNTWSNFTPVVAATAGPTPTATITMISARILVPFQNRLLAFNTWEQEMSGLNNYSSRMRFSAEGNPIDNTGTYYYPWRQDIGGAGGALDFPSQEPIVSVEFIKDRLIVFLDESTWEVVYTGNQIQPFALQQINTEFGVESTFSIIPFDKVILAIGNLGIIACTGNNVERIDDKIPDNVFEIHNINGGVDRVFGIRDYETEMAYWAFPSSDATSTLPYPNQVLVYNYKNGTWAFNDDSITCFGYYQATAGTTWASQTVLWNSDVTWSDGSSNALFKAVIAGNQQGWTFIVNRDTPTNCAALQITNMSTGNGIYLTITSIDHNLREVQDYVYLQGITGTLSTLNGLIFQVIPIVDSMGAIDPDNFNIYTDAMGTYTGGGTLARVSNIQLQTKQYNFYMDKGRNAYVSKIDFLVDATFAGQIQVDYYVSTSANSMLADSAPISGSGSLLGTGILETFPYPTVPFEENASQLWHPCYIQADGEFIQLNISMTPDQMMNVNVMISDFQLHSMIFYATPTSSRLQ